MGLSQQKWCSSEGSWGGIKPWTLVRGGWASILPVLGDGSPRYTQHPELSYCLWSKCADTR